MRSCMELRTADTLWSSNMKSQLVILGTRGSVPVSGEAFLRYGGETTCVLLQLAEQTIVLDAGTGMLALPSYLEKENRQITLLLSHAHADHLLGLPMSACVFDPENRIIIYGADRDSRTVREQVCALLAPPLWPVGPEQLPADITFHSLPETMTLGTVTVDTMDGIHPGGVSLFRITGAGKRIIFATDCTLSPSFMPRLTEFAKDCDLLLCDGQYSPEEWAGKSGFGHSTWTAAAELGAACGAKQVRIIHHDPCRTDEALDAAGAELNAIHPRCQFARAGERIIL